MADNSFFDESKEQSKVKIAIVSKYFEAWANVMVGTLKRHPKMGNFLTYLDMFAGRGYYEDLTPSTPILVLNSAIANDDLQESLVTIFNDKDQENSELLMEAIRNLPNIHLLSRQPIVKNKEVNLRTLQEFMRLKVGPTLSFLDPWGYKGLSLELIDTVTKDWGCDCIFFFNYRRVNPGLNNPAFAENMNLLFGPERAERLSKRIEKLNAEQRELTIIEELAQAIKDSGKPYVLPFRFRDERGTRTNHHLFFVSKGLKGYEIMKDIMAGESTSNVQGVPSFEYNPADTRQPLLFELNRPLDELGNLLLNDFAGQSRALKELYDEHHIDRRYTKKNYRDILLKLELKRSITADPPINRRTRSAGQMTDATIIKFPKVN